MILQIHIFFLHFPKMILQFPYPCLSLPIVMLPRFFLSLQHLHQLLNLLAHLPLFPLTSIGLALLVLYLNL
jgi:hypothetical protein